MSIFYCINELDFKKNSILCLVFEQSVHCDVLLHGGSPEGLL